jgi:drug/metabolite transporter (DMT)-like permease
MSLSSRAHKEGRSTALAAVFSLPIIWGTTFAVVQRALGDVSPMAFVVIRFSIASLFFLAISSSARKSLHFIFRPRTPHERRFRKDMIVMGIAIGGGYIFQTIGLVTTTSAKSAFLTSTTVIWVPLLALALGHERITPILGTAVAVTIVGIFLMTHPFSSGGIVIGDVLTIGCAMAFAVYIIIIDTAMLHVKEFSASEHEASLIVTAGQLITGSIIFLLCMPILETPTVHLTKYAVGSLVYTGIFATCLTAYLQSRYQHHISPTAASIIYMLEPVVAALIAWFILGEYMGAAEAIGAGLIVAGVVISQIKVGKTNVAN